MRAARADLVTALLAAPQIAPSSPPLTRGPEQGWSGARNGVSAQPGRQLKEKPIESHRFSSPRPITLNCASDISATIPKISVEIAAANPKFWPESVKAMR